MVMTLQRRLLTDIILTEMTIWRKTHPLRWGAFYSSKTVLFKLRPTLVQWTAAVYGQCSPLTYLVTTRYFRSSASQNFKFKLKIKDPDENQALTPIDYDNVPALNLHKKRMYEDDDGVSITKRNQSAIYQRNQQKKAAFHVDAQTRARVIKSWPLVTMDLNALKDKDIPLGIKFSIAYHDTHAYERHSGPVVLILHGLQLPAVNFFPLIEPLVERGCRVLAPIFPYVGHNIFKANPNLVTTSKDMDVFSHSTIEQGMFASDFVQGVLGADRRVDIVVASDIASYPGIWLGANSFAKGFVFLDAFPAKPLKIMKPVFLYKWMCKSWEVMVWRWFSLPFMAWQMTTSRFGSTSFKEASVHARNVAFADFDALDGGLTTMDMRRVPAVVYASKRNKYVPASDARELMRRLGIEDRCIVDLDSESSPSSSSSTASGESSRSGDGLRNFVKQSDDRTLDAVGSVGKFFEPREQDAFGRYNRRYAKSDWYHLALPIANDIHRMINEAKK